MNTGDVRVKQHPIHHVNPVSSQAYKQAKKKHPPRGMQIIQLLGAGDMTTLMLAKQLGCQSSDITQVVLDLRKLGVIVNAGVGRDPYTGHPAHFWTLNRTGQPGSANHAA